MFTHQSILETLQGSQDQPKTDAFVGRWKQVYLQHISETGQQGVSGFLIDLEHYRTTEK